MKFIIKDWANNICFQGQEFGSFDDAWDFLYVTFPAGEDDRVFDDYFVEEIGSDHYVDESLARQGIK